MGMVFGYITMLVVDMGFSIKVGGGGRAWDACGVGGSKF